MKLLLLLSFFLFSSSCGDAGAHAKNHHKNKRQYEAQIDTLEEQLDALTVIIGDQNDTIRTLTDTLVALEARLADLQKPDPAPVDPTPGCLCD